MLITPNPSAIFPELLWQQGQLRVIYQIDDTLFLSSVQSEVVISFPCSVGAFPKCDRSWCIYRNQGAAFLWNTERSPSLVEVVASPIVQGVDPVAIGFGFVAWQGNEGFPIFGRARAGGPAVFLRPGAPTGISRVLPDGRVRLVDEDRTSVPGMTRPHWSGPYVVGEHPQGGVLVRHQSGQETWLWPGEETFTPRALYLGNRVAVVTWGQQGVRLEYVMEPPVPTQIMAMSAPTHVYFAEGTAWRTPPLRETWLGLFNPSPTAQGVSVTVFPENAAPQMWSTLLSPWQRQGLNLYDAFFSSGPPRRVNFATQVVFERLGVASLTTWPADYSLPAYVPPTYGQGASA